jgi:hypothetical protein
MQTVRLPSVLLSDSGRTRLSRASLLRTSGKGSTAECRSPSVRPSVLLRAGLRMLLPALAASASGPPARRRASARSRSRLRIFGPGGRAWRSGIANSNFSVSPTPGEPIHINHLAENMPASWRPIWCLHTLAGVSWDRLVVLVAAWPPFHCGEASHRRKCPPDWPSC